MGTIIRKMKVNRFSFPFCVLAFVALGILFRSFAIIKQSESELRLREEVQALSDEFGVDFSVTLQELVTRGIVSPSLAASIEPPQTSSSTPHRLSIDDDDDGDDDEEHEQQQEEEEDEDGFESPELRAGVHHEHDKAQINAKQSRFLDPAKWMKPGVKYFVYQSSGGLSNQRIMLESALILGKLLNRTVIVPQLGPHTSMWYNFNNIAVHDFIPADLLLDGDSIRSLAPVEFLKGNVTFREFLAVNENPETWYRVLRNKVMDKRLYPWDMQYLVDHFAHIDSPVLVFARGTMWECFDFPSEVLDSARRAVRAHPSLRKVARELALELFPNGFNSLHIRFMDNDGTFLREGLLKPAPSFIARMKQFDKSLPLYIATVPRKRYSTFFTPFSVPFKTIVFGDALEQDPRVHAFIGRYTRKMQTTILGLIEQLVCARGEMFLGTGYSTFSEHIRRMRRWRELAVVEDLVDAKEREQERIFASKETPCISPLLAC